MSEDIMHEPGKRTFITKRNCIGLVVLICVVVTLSYAFFFKALPVKLLKSPYFYIVDLDNDGIELVDYDDSQILYDVDGDGYAEKTSWVGDGEGFLVVLDAKDQDNYALINQKNESLYNLALEHLINYDVNLDKVYNRLDYVRREYSEDFSPLGIGVYLYDDNMKLIDRRFQSKFQCKFVELDFSQKPFKLICNEKKIYDVYPLHFKYSDINHRWDSMCYAMQKGASRSEMAENSYIKFCN